MFTVKTGKGYNRAALYFYKGAEQIAYIVADPRSDYNCLGLKFHGGLGRGESHRWELKVPYIRRVYKPNNLQKVQNVLNTIQDKLLRKLDKVGK